MNKHAKRLSVSHGQRFAAFRQSRRQAKKQGLSNWLNGKILLNSILAEISGKIQAIDNASSKFADLEAMDSFNKAIGTF